MSTFFCGWRRKVGCVLVVVALALIVTFARSYAVYHMAAYALGGRQFMVQSGQGYVIWSGWSPHDDDPVMWTCDSFNTSHNQDRGLIVRQLAISGSPNSVSWPISYWWLIAPVTLLSAYLLLWKPRKRFTPTPPD